MKNVLLDKALTYLNQEKYAEYTKDYSGKKYAVGEDIPETSSDEDCANFCITHDCDFLTVDKKAYDHFFKIEQIESVEISQFLKNEPPAPEGNSRPVYCMKPKTKQ